MEPADELYFILYASCIPVGGAKRGCLCDIQRGNIKIIPSLLVEILTNCKTCSIAALKTKYKNEYDEGIDNYFSLLVKEDWGFFTPEPEKFPDISMTWETPLKITNAIVDLGFNNAGSFNSILDQLALLGCESIQVRVYEAIDVYGLFSSLGTIKTSRIKSLELILKYQNNFNDDFFLEMVKVHRRIRSVFIHSSPFKRKVAGIEKMLVSIDYGTEGITGRECCGIIHERFFALNINLFTESINYNSCLNRKISVDVNGNIKNCPSMQKSYGNIKDVSLQEALDKQGFKDVWNIKKDNIKICRDCEFRHICTDCRAYIEKPGDIYSKPLKCGYDPYTNKWEEWSTNPLKQDAIDYYGMHDLITSG